MKHIPKQKGGSNNAKKRWNWERTKYSWRINTRKNMMNAILEASKIAAKWEIDSL